MSANLAAKFASWGTGAVIDLDPQGNLSRAFPCTEWGAASAATVLTDAAANPDRVIEPDEWTVYQLPDGNVLYGLATTNQDHLSHCQEILAATESGEGVLSRLLSSQTELDFVIIDTPPSVGRLTFNAVMASDLVYTVINDTAWSVEGGLATKSYVEAITNSGFGSAQFGGAILNRYDRRSVVARVVRGLVEKEPDFQVMEPSLPSRVCVQESEFRGIPAVSLEPGNDFSIAMSRLAETIWQRGQEKPNIQHQREVVGQ